MLRRGKKKIKHCNCTRIPLQQHQHTTEPLTSPKYNLNHTEVSIILQYKKCLGSMTYTGGNKFLAPHSSLKAAVLKPYGTWREHWVYEAEWILIRLDLMQRFLKIYCWRVEMCLLAYKQKICHSVSYGETVSEKTNTGNVRLENTDVETSTNKIVNTAFMTDF